MKRQNTDTGPEISLMLEGLPLELHTVQLDTEDIITHNLLKLIFAILPA